LLHHVVVVVAGTFLLWSCRIALSCGCGCVVFGLWSRCVVLWSRSRRVRVVVALHRVVVVVTSHYIVVEVVLHCRCLRCVAHRCCLRCVAHRCCLRCIAHRCCLRRVAHNSCCSCGSEASMYMYPGCVHTGTGSWQKKGEKGTHRVRSTGTGCATCHRGQPGLVVA